MLELRSGPAGLRRRGCGQSRPSDGTLAAAEPAIGQTESSFAFPSSCHTYTYVARGRRAHSSIIVGDATLPALIIIAKCKGIRGSSRGSAFFRLSFLPRLTPHHPGGPAVRQSGDANKPGLVAASPGFRAHQATDGGGSSSERPSSHGFGHGERASVRCGRNLIAASVRILVA